MYNTVIIIPYRNRKAQLDHFIAKTAPLIEKYMPNTIILVVEQFSDDKLFNRGYLLNVGFKEYENNTKYFIMHDVDINPTQLFIESHYNSDINDETALCLYTSTSNTFGGIVKITENTIKKINGFPNDIWGWGTEDKALQNRGEFYNIKKNVIFYVNSAEENNDYLTRDEQADIIRENISKVIAIRAIYYLQQGKANLGTDWASAFHDLSEGFGFVYSLQFTRKPGTTSAYFSTSEVNGFISTLTSGDGFWELTADQLDTMSNTIGSRFGISVSQAGS